MIVEYKGKEYIAFYLFFCTHNNNGYPSKMLCWNIEESYLDYIYFLDAEITDGRFTPNMSIHKQHAYDSQSVVAVLEHDMIFRESSWFWEAFDDEDPKANLLFHKVINEMKEFHGLPIDDLSELEEEVRKQEEAQKVSTEEERRMKALSDELDEYLRIGEEIENKKKLKSQNNYETFYTPYKTEYP